MIPLRQIVVVVLMVCTPAMSFAVSAGAADCRVRLAQSLSVMEAAPLMKEEKATGLMWLRLDAQHALEQGAVELCHKKLEAVEAILLIDGLVEFSGESEAGGGFKSR